MGDKNFRLPRDLRPERYVFRIRPDLQTKTFDAAGHIELVFDRPVEALTLHGVHLDVSTAAIGEVKATTSVDEISETVTFTFERPVEAGHHKLDLVWTGIFHDDLRGLYLAGGVGVTQFEAADARRVFPCFDEPPFKAVWELSVEAPASVTVLANGALVKETPTQGGYSVRVFAPTPRMSSYLVALVVGDLKGSDTAMARSTPVRTWTVPGKEHLTAFAQECSAAVLPLLEDYFGRPYVFGKVDNVGIPDFEAGAMENSGLVTYREVALLLDDANAAMSVRKRVAEVITHELAHQWFGNLVTMGWWDDLWLNEAFATWMSYKIVDQWKPGWRVWDEFESGKHTALHLDALASTHPIKYEVLNADQATENFDAITYEKGGAMLRMIEGWLGADAFRQGIRHYIRTHEFANTVADDLWNALGEASGQPVAEVTNAWLARGGYPLVDVSVDGAEVKLSQRRFSLDPERFANEPDEPWFVPVVLRWADDAGVHERAHLLKTRDDSVTLPATGQVKWVYGNRGGAGFYRVRYDDRNHQALMANLSALQPVERVNLLSDAWALFRAGGAPLRLLLDALRVAAADDDYTVTGEVVSRLEGLERRCLRDEDRKQFQAFAASLLEKRLAALGWDSPQGESDDRRLTRAALVRGLTLVARQPAAIAEAQTRLARSWAGEPALDPNLLDAVGVATARAGDEKLFDTLIERLKDDRDPASQRRTLVALASFESPQVRQRSIDLLLDEAVVPMQDATTYFGALIANPAARDEVFDFTLKRWDEVRKRTAAPFLTRRFVEALGDLTHRRAEVEQAFDAHAASLQAVPAALRQTRERLRLDEDVLVRGGDELGKWLKAGG